MNKNRMFAERPPRESGFLSTIVSLWFEQISLGVIGLVFAEALVMASTKIQTWSFYLKPSEIFFEVVVRVIFTALAGIALGSACTAAVAPFLWYFKSSRARLAAWSTKVAVVVVLFVDSRFALTTLIKWSGRGVRFTSVLLVLHFAFFVIAICIPRARKQLVGSLGDFMGEKMTRRTAIATVGGAAALIATEFVIGKTGRAAMSALPAQRPDSNILLITFDALDAEDMSVYGNKLLTTPNIDAFASKGTVFTNFYSASTFTTPSIATMMTGIYPSESHVHQLQGRPRGENAARTLPHVMRAAGFATGAFLSNPYAYYLGTSLENGYDVLPEPVFQKGGLAHLWDVIRPIHQDTGFGNRFDEYHDLETTWSIVGRMDTNLSMRFRPDASFAKAREVLAKLPAGNFMWVHLITPHHPYLPDPTEQGRFLPYEEQRGFEQEEEDRWRPRYEPDQQSQVDKRRLLYDEFILTADRAFGDFMSELEKDGKLRNTTVIVSADHGESFEGGVFRHQTPYQTRPVIHVPLIIRQPGQQQGSRVAFTADQTALAPTILELAGQPKPGWMRGQSLVEWLNRNGQGDGEGQAFTQYLEKNSSFKPVHHGTVGVIDGRSHYQYILDLDTQKGLLRPLDEAQIWDRDHTSENPALAKELRAAIYSRFPDLLQKP
jgi:arylsulfatase A-like enzyme